MIEKLGVIAAIILPLWNIPLIVRIIKRRSSQDVSMYWAAGVWTCFLFMFPSGLMSGELVWKVFNIGNMVLFTGVFASVLWYRKGR